VAQGQLWYSRCWARKDLAEEVVHSLGGILQRGITQTYGGQKQLRMGGNLERHGHGQMRILSFHIKLYNMILLASKRLSRVHQDSSSEKTGKQVPLDTNPAGALEPASLLPRPPTRTSQEPTRTTDTILSVKTLG
jgi:hypothetical protein